MGHNKKVSAETLFNKALKLSEDSSAYVAKGLYGRASDALRGSDRFLNDAAKAESRQ